MNEEVQGDSKGRDVLRAVSRLMRCIITRTPTTSVSGAEHLTGAEKTIIAAHYSPGVNPHRNLEVCRLTPDERYALFAHKIFSSASVARRQVSNGVGSSNTSRYATRYNFLTKCASDKQNLKKEDVYVCRIQQILWQKCRIYDTSVDPLR